MTYKWIGWGLQPEMYPDGCGSPSSQTLLNLFMGDCFKMVQMWLLRRQELSFNMPGFRIHTVIILKTNSHVDLKMGRGRLGKRGSSEAEAFLPPWQAPSAGLPVAWAPRGGHAVSLWQLHLLRCSQTHQTRNLHGIYGFCRLFIS